MKSSNNGIEKALWSAAIPGFGQLLNGKYIKGLALVLLEFLINYNAKINKLIILSFLGKTQLAADEANYQWLMFYPCVYIFAIWDAYRDGVDNLKPLMFIPFVTAAYIETLGVVYSSSITIGGILPGPIFLPLISIFLGFGVGLLIRYFILKLKKDMYAEPFQKTQKT